MLNSWVTSIDKEPAWKFTSLVSRDHVVLNESTRSEISNPRCPPSHEIFVDNISGNLRVGVVSVQLDSATINITKTATDNVGVTSLTADIKGPLPASTVIGTVALSLVSGTPQSGTLISP